MTKSFLFFNQDGENIDIEDGVKFFESDAKRRIALTRINNLTISTVFLVIDHGAGSGRPVLFESIVFKASNPIFTQRYCTKEEAKAGHDKLVEQYSGALKKKAKRKVEL